VKTRFVHGPWRCCAGLFAGALLPLAVLAEPVPSPQAQAWHDANQAVAEFPRGHADVLKWEQQNHQPQHHPGKTVPDEASPPGMVLGSAEEAVRLAWQQHRDLARPLARLGAAQATLMANGQWLALDPSLLRRIEGVDELLAVAAQTRKAWLQAVASQQVLPHLQRAQDAAEAAAELGQRMVSTGNWSALQQSQVLLARSNARMALLRAQYAAAQAQHALLQAVQSQGRYSAVTVPGSPAPMVQTPDAWSPTAFEQRLAQAQSHWPWGDQTLQTAQARLAYAAYQASQALARIQQSEVLPQREFILNETVLHYNGMLKSTWDMLTEAQAQAQAQVNAVNAQRDADLALIDLQWVLLGGGPDSLLTLGGSDSTPAAGNGH